MDVDREPPDPRSLLEAFASDLPTSISLEREWSPCLSFSVSVNGRVFIRDVRDAAARGPRDVLTDLVDTLDGIQESIIEDGVGRAWPVCPVHGHHPLTTAPVGWQCQFTMDRPKAVTASQVSGTWSYGSFRGNDIVPSPGMDHVVRWYRRDWAWGIIADAGGDVWFHDNDFNDPEHERLWGQEEVLYVVGGRQGALRSVVPGSLLLRKDVPPATIDDARA
jgi:cold shock CspA family protein